MNRISNIATFLCLLTSTAQALADSAVQANLWARATPPGSSSAAIYGEIVNQGRETLELERIDLSAAHHVMIHRTIEEDGVMRMKHASVQLAPEGSVLLKPGDLHIMVMGLNRPFKQGCSETVRLVWSDGETSEHIVHVGSFGQQAPPDIGSIPCN